MAKTYTFSAGAAIVAAELNTNFDDLLNEVSGITVADLHANSGLLSTNLADRFGTCRETYILAPRQDFDAGSYTVLSPYLPNAAPAAAQEAFRTYMTLRSGKAAYLIDVSIFALDITVATATAYPGVIVTRNGTTLGGGEAQIQADATRYRLANTNPFDNPLTSLADGDYLSVQLGTAPVAAADTQWSAVSITFTYKIELGA